MTQDRSDPRNPLLVQMFRFIGLAEEAGRGIATIISAWRQLGFRLPAIDAGSERYEFAITLRYAHFFSEDDRTWLQALGHNLSEAQQLALVLARHQDELENSTLRRLTGLHPADVTKVLRELRNQGLLIIDGAGRGARYRLAQAASLVSGARSSSAGIDASSVGNTESSAGIDLSSTGNEEHPADRGTNFSQSLWQELKAIAAHTQSTRRLAPEARDDLILRLCERAPLSLDELARLMHRNEGYLRVHIRQLLKSHRLSYVYPQQPTHPDQRYVAAKNPGRV